MEEENKEIKKLQLPINETVVITYLSGLVYLAAFYYEVGFCTHFNIPIHLISPTLTTILNFGGVILLFLLWYLSYGGNQFNLLNPEPINIALLLIMASLLVGAIIFVGYGSSSALIIWACVFIVIIVLIIVFKQKLIKFNVNVLGYILRRKFIASFIFAIIVIGSSYLVGNGKSHSQKNYTIIKNYKNVVALRQYDDLLICAEYNPKTKLLREGFIILNISGMDSLVLKESFIGPLKVYNEKK